MLFHPDGAGLMLFKYGKQRAYLQDWSCFMQDLCLFAERDSQFTREYIKTEGN